ncbi:MAG: DNA repair exonuclease [Actinomycetia bacterium]|nr:DNA repair exonuclease [Actinomycetes bacterium]
MRIIHTSDLHLSSKKPERFKALENIISTAKKKRADLLLISGDLFDSNEEADILRPGLRNIFSSLPFSIIAIPGNHDMEAYRSDMNFGNSIRVAVKQPFEIIDHKDISIIAVPYANQNFNDLAGPLKERINNTKINILMIHCSLDIPYLGEDEYGDEKRQAYLPVNSKILGDIGFDYVFAGHFHSRVVENRISEKTIFTYSGSPVSITRKEKGRRRIAFLDTKTPGSRRLSFIGLDSFYYESIGIDFHPGKEEGALSDLREKLENYKGQEVELEISLGGFISSGEKEIGKKIRQIAEEAGSQKTIIDIKENYRGIKAVLEDPLYMAFKERLMGKDMEQDLKDEIDSLVIMQFSRMKT